MVNAGRGRRERQFGVVCCRHTGGREAGWVLLIKVGVSRCRVPSRGLAPDAFVLVLMMFGGPDVIRKEALPFYRTISGVRLCWELEEPK